VFSHRGKINGTILEYGLIVGYEWIYLPLSSSMAGYEVCKLKWRYIGGKIIELNGVRWWDGTKAGQEVVENLPVSVSIIFH
jgi:hypothetical protein